jgi:hypothetical protein
LGLQGQARAAAALDDHQTSSMCAGIFMKADNAARQHDGLSSERRAIHANYRDLCAGRVIGI